LVFIYTDIFTYEKNSAYYLYYTGGNFSTAGNKPYPMEFSGQKAD
jgi:hypothetical protein